MSMLIRKSTGPGKCLAGFLSQVLKQYGLSFDLLLACRMISKTTVEIALSEKIIFDASVPG